MARALLFRAGTVGLVCAAYEVEIIGGSELRPASMNTVRDCTNPATVMLETEGGCKTAFCQSCRDLIVESLSIPGTVGRVQIQRPRNN